MSTPTAFGEPPFSFAAAIKSGPTVKPPRIVLMGVEGVGKSTAGAQMDAPIFLCSEDGLVGPQFRDTKHFSAADWEQVLGFLDYLLDSPHPYKTVVVDTVDWLEPKLYHFICKRDGEKDIESYGFGKGYTAAATEFRKFVRRLDSLNRKGMAVLVLAHTQVKAFNNPTGENYDRYEPKADKKVAGIIKEWADAVLFAEFQTFAVKTKGASKAKGVGGQERIVHTQRSAGWDAKNRYGLPDEMPFDMPSILDAIASGNGAGGDAAKDIADEIREIYASLPDDKKAKIDADIEKNGDDAAAMSRILNRVRATITKETKNV